MTFTTVTNVFKLVDGSSYDGERFKKAVEPLSKEKGVVRQYWGEQVENPGLVTWVIDYASPEEASRIRGSSTYLTVINSLTEFLEVIDQVNSGLMTEWASSTYEVDAAMQSAITEVAFFKLDTTIFNTADAKKIIEMEMENICSAVKEFGKATGAAVGWIDNKDSSKVLLHGVFGYDSLEDHLKWRKHPVHIQAQDAFVRLVEQKIILMPDVRVKGVDAEKGYSHVKFGSG